MKVKIFTFSSPQDLEKEANRWLEAVDPSVQTIVQSQSMEDNQLFITLTVFYKEKDKESKRPKGITRTN